MKHLKTYESYIDKDLTDEIKDIVGELVDEGYIIDVKYYPFGNDTWIKRHIPFRYWYVVQMVKMIGRHTPTEGTEGETLQKIWKKSLGDTTNLNTQISHLKSFMEEEGFPVLEIVYGCSSRENSPGRRIDEPTVFLFFSKHGIKYESYWKGTKLEPNFVKKSEQDLNDVLSHLKDDGFPIEVKVVEDYDTHIFVNILDYEFHESRKKNDKSIKWKDIKSDIERSIDLVGDKFSASVYYKFVNPDGRIPNRGYRDQSSWESFKQYVKDDMDICFLSIEFTEK